MIYITGDTHGQQDFSKLSKFANEHPKLDKKDYVIIAGDFGAIWNKNTLEEDLMPYENLSFTVLFVDGNHENFNLLNAYPVELWNGGKIHRIKPSIIHLMRGQIFEIEEKRFFSFGGGTSRDKNRRIENVSWWKEEMPSIEEYMEAKNNLQRFDNRVDYVITHCPPAYLTNYLYRRSLMRSRYGNSKFCLDRGSCDYLIENIVNEIANAKIFFCGHEHIDEILTLREQVHILLYNKIVRIS